MTDTPEPARRLYEALRTAQMLPEGWGGWEHLQAVSPDLEAKVRRCAALLWPEPEPVVEAVPVGEPSCHHHWEVAACRHNHAIFYCCHCLEVREVPVHG